MTKGTFFVVTVATLLVAYAGWHATGAILAALVLFGAYFLSVRIHPRTRHGRCGGTGEHHGVLLAWGHRKCPGCDGGRMVRWGAGQFGSEAARNEYTIRRQARQTARERHTWR